MNFKQLMKQKIIPLLLAVAIIMSGITIFPSTVQAAGWLDYADQTINLGTAVSGSIKSGDYYGQTEGKYSVYWHIYKFTMPQAGLLNIYIESLSDRYLYYSWSSDSGFVVFSGADSDKVIWRSRNYENEIERNYSASRAMYYGSTEIALEQGEYYFAVRQTNINDTPYYLTLSYKEPVINVTSISLNPSKMTLAAGAQKTITATILPNNATDKTVAWRSDNPSVATVADSGTVIAVSVGTASITASSSDGEITATCAVTVTCPHEYQTAFAPATKNSNGYITEKCRKCGDIRKDQTIYAIRNVTLTRKTATHNGKVQVPSITVQDTRGKTLTHDTDYTLSYIGNMRDAGKHSIQIKFKGNYKGKISRTFTILPKPTAITKITPKKKGFTVSWKKQATQTTGYELAYSTDRKFARKNTRIISISKNKTSKKTVSKLKSGRKYYVRIRTYKNVKTNGKTTRLYSGWSKVKTVTTKR